MKWFRTFSKTNVIFLGCNYSNKKVKGHFDALKTKWEREWPVRVVLIDKEKAKGSRDLWREISEAIQSASLVIFDVSAFRPNVVLELGFALALKHEEDIIISFDERKKKKAGKKPEWLLSDISHRNRINYKSLSQLDKYLEENLTKVPAIKHFMELKATAEDETSIPEKYADVALKALHTLRDSDNVTMSDDQLASLTKGTNVRIETLKRILKKHKLAKRYQGPNGRWYLVDK